MYFVHSLLLQVLPPSINNGVNADSGYDAEGISLIADPDENASLNNSDDEDEDRAVRFAAETEVHEYAPPPALPPPCLQSL